MQAMEGVMVIYKQKEALSVTYSLIATWTY
jgi:hypothetical protein